MESKKSNEPKSRRLFLTILVAVVVVLVIGCIAGYAIYRQEIAPFETVVLRIDEKEIKMRYFLKRLRMGEGNPSFGGPISLLSMIAQEEIIKEKAPRTPYNLSVTPEEIEGFLKTLARRGSESITEEEYQEWYRQQLNQTQLSKSEFEELTRTQVLRQKLSDYLAVRAPTVAEQIHLHMIVQKSPEASQKVQQRLQAGEDFYQLAQELNPSEETRENQGDLGWHTKNGLQPRLAQLAFQLEVGDHSQPIPLSKDAFVIVKVVEKAAARELSKEQQERQKFGLVEQWAANEFQFHKISYHGLTEGKGWDSQTHAWANWQMQRMNSEKEGGQ